MDRPKRLRELRIAAGLTQAELARALGLRSHAHVSNIENGEGQPSLDILDRWLALTNGRLEIVTNAADTDPLRALSWEERQIVKIWRTLAPPERSVGLALVMLLPRLTPEQLALLDHLRVGFEKSAPSGSAEAGAVEPRRQRASKRRGPRG